MPVVTLVLLALIALASPQAPAPPPPPAPQPPRDVLRAERAGTAIIRGRVVAADTGLPIRQANVTLVEDMSRRGPAANRMPPGQSNRPRTAKTDDHGGFEFKGLPAGTYRVNASTTQFSAQYLPLAYGAKRPMMDPGLPIDLGDGQTFDKATIALPRGGVIAGRVTDENGEPMARVQVMSLFFAPGSTRGQRWGPTGFSQTDDLGQFRLYGLQPGDYTVMAEARMGFMAPTAANNESDDDRTGFVTTYFPGTPDEGSAQRLRLRSGGETTGVEIRMSKGRLYRVTGLVVDSHGTPMSGVNGMVGRRSSASGVTSNGFTTDEQGRFVLQNLTPGDYRVVVRQRQQAFGPNGPEGDPGEMANVPMTIAGGDIENLTIVTAPGVTVTGRVEFEPGPPERPPTQMRLAATPADPENGMMFGPQPNTVVQRDMTFKLQGLIGELMVRSFGGLPPNSYLKAVLLGGVDIADVPREFKAGDELTVVVSLRPSSIEGTVTDAKGTPITDAGIIAFPDDKALWRSNSTRVRRGSPDAQGRYHLMTIHPGRYYVVAAPRERLNTFPGIDYPAFYEELSKDATTVVVNEDETRTVDLKVVIQGGGQ